MTMTISRGCRYAVCQPGPVRSTSNSVQDGVDDPANVPTTVESCGRLVSSLCLDVLSITNNFRCAYTNAHLLS